MKIQNFIQEQIHMEHVPMRQSNIALSDNISAKLADLDRASFEYTEGISADETLFARSLAHRLRKEPTNRIPWPLQGPCMIYEGA